MMRGLVLWGVAWATLMTSEAHAGRHEISGELAVNNLPSGSVGTALGRSDLVGGGVRAGYAVLRNHPRFGLVIRGGWSMARASGVQPLPSPLSSSHRGIRLYDLASEVTTHHAQVGLKADVEVGGFFYPYVAIDAGLVAAGLQQSMSGGPRGEDPHRDGAIAPSGTFLLGTDWMIPDRKLGLPVTVAFHVEGGYFISGNLRFQEVGAEQALRGAVLRAGMGLRF